MNPNAPTLGIFAKEPAVGRVKTRLCPPLTPEQATEFYRLSLDETIRRSLKAGCRTVIFYTGDERYFQQNYPEIPRYPQRGDDLGARMDNALRELLSSGCSAAALIGSDSPDLPLGLFDEAFSTLRECSAVIAPSRDGGYVLVGESTHHPELFTAIPWSTPEVLPMTRRRAAEHAIPLREITSWEDVDDEPSLRRMIARSPGSRCAEWASALLD